MKIKHLIPNTLSLANCILGFFIIVFISRLNVFISQTSSNANIARQTEITFIIISIMMILSAFFDKMDGSIARWLKVNHPMGENLDSLADVISFGIAPGLLMYVLHFHQYSMELFKIELPIGVALSSVYPVCAVYRLARFNTNEKSSFFVGLPSPIAALSILSLAILFFYKNYSMSSISIILIFVFVSLLMISRIQFKKTPNFFNLPLNFIRIFLLILIIILCCYYFDWFWTLFSILMLYLFSSLYLFIINVIQNIKISIVSNGKDNLHE